MLTVAMATATQAQETTDNHGMDILDLPVEQFQSARKQTWYWAGKNYVFQGDTIWTILMPEMPVYQPLVFKSRKQMQKYNRLVYNVKKVLPLAQQANAMIQETYKVMEMLPDKKAKQEHIKQVEKEIMKTYKPEMKKLTYAQGKLLIKLIDRQCDMTGYELIKKYMGGFKAGFYNAFASLFGASLKKQYDPEVDDRLTERAILLIESGQM